ncbi:MAG TPA: ATP synthase F1 subunit delta [Acidimicrobiales bacterium]|jgi:F-type H+-transporting ATPase subunit delta
MSDERIDGYATALFAVAKVEGTLLEVEDELFRFARTFESSDELRATLTDANVPVDRRQQIIEDLLGSKASPTTTAVLSFVVGAGRARDLPAICDALVERAASERSSVVADVRSAIDLPPEVVQRLAAALGTTTGRQVEVKVIVDPTVVGGLVATVGDTVIDGSVRRRLELIRDRFSGT